jgi:hypothetical protein
MAYNVSCFMIKQLLRNLSSVSATYKPAHRTQLTGTNRNKIFLVLNYLSLYLRLYSPLSDIGRFFSLLIILHNRYDSLDGGSACRKAATYTQDNTNTG